MRSAHACGSRAKASGWMREAVDRRRPEADDGIGQVVEPLPHGPARRVRLALGEPAHARAHEQLDARRVGAVGEQRALDAVVARADDGDALAREVVVAAALEHDADARIAGGSQRRRARAGTA